MRNELFRYNLICKLSFLLPLFFRVIFSQAAWAKDDQKTPAPVAAVSKEDLENTSAPEKDLGSTILDFIKGEKPAEKINEMDSGLKVKVIASRLPDNQSPLRDVPANISLKTKKELQWSKPLTFQEAVQDEEGIVLYDAVGNRLDTTFSMRGFAGPGDVTFVMDGVRLNEVDGNGMTYPLIAMNDLESIQIQRGSSSPIYGSGGFGGVVNITSGRPSEKPLRLFGGLEISSFKGLRFHQGFSGTLQDKVTPIGGKYFYYFDGGRNVSEGEGFRGNGDYRITNFDIKTGYELPEEQGKIEVGVKHLAESIHNPGELTFQQFQNDSERTNKPLDGHQYENTIVSVNGMKKLWDNHITTSALGSWRLQRNDFFTTFGTFTDFPDGFNPDTNLVESKSRDSDFTWQVQYDDQWKEVGNETLFGTEYRHGGAHSVQRDWFRGSLSNTATETDRVAQADDFAIFWRETLKFFDKVIPYFGMRHDFNWISAEDNLNPANDISRRWNSSTLSTGVTVKPVDPVDLFFNYSQGYRTPTIDDLVPFSGAIATGLSPERADSYEVGTRLRYKDVAQNKTSFFLIDTKDEIIFDSNVITATTPFGQNINIGRTRRYGIEERLDLNPIQELHLYGSYAWLIAYVRETSSTGSPVDGRTLGQIPEDRFTLGGEVQPLKRLGEPFDGFKFGLDGIFTGRQHPGSYQSASQATLNATGGAGHYIKPYAVFNFKASYNWREKEIYFKINNLFDEHYYSRAVNATSFGTAIYPAGTYTFVDPGAPRELILGSRWQFE